MSDYQRVITLARYLRNQVSLADRPPVGRVELNNEEAIVAADALTELAQQLGSIENPLWSWKNLAEFFQRHAIISKAQPACFVCDSQAMPWPPRKQHPELPNIVVCDACYTRARNFHVREKS